MGSIMIRVILCVLVVGFIEASQEESQDKPWNKHFCNTEKSKDQLGRRSCASALWDEVTPNKSCFMWYPGIKSDKIIPTLNSKECDEWSLMPDKESEIADLGKVKLQAFSEYYESLWQTGINVTFADIKWTTMRTRFKEDGYNLVNLCREFTISPEPVDPDKKLFYDCVWNLMMDEKEFQFEFNASRGLSSSFRRYRFRAPLEKYINPKNKKLNESELFMYMDITDLPLIKLHLQTAKERFDIGWENYMVTIHHNASGYETQMILKPAVKEDDQITYHFQTNSEKGSYYFTAKINHPNCTQEPGCFVSKSPTIVIKSHPHKDIILIAIAGCGAVILSILSFVYFIWRLRSNSFMAPRPTVLLVYKPTSAKHTYAVLEFARFLKKFCHIDALVDELGIPMTESKDPFQWCTDAFSKANAIMVLASPRVACEHYKRIYRNIDALSLRLLREKMSDTTLEMKYLTAVLPYCVNNMSSLPEEAKHLRRFHLPSNLDKMLTYIHTGSASYYHKFCISPLISEGLSEISRNESDLVKAIKIAEEEIREGVQKCNHCNGAHSDNEGGPLLAMKFTSIDVPMGGDDDDDDRTLMWPEIKNSPLVDEMFPGPIGDLNLLGSEGSNCVSNPQLKNMVSSGLNLNELDLG